jgi:hypothetical protein
MAQRRSQESDFDRLLLGARVWVLIAGDEQVATTHRHLDITSQQQAPFQLLEPKASPTHRAPPQCQENNFFFLSRAFYPSRLVPPVNAMHQVILAYNRQNRHFFGARSPAFSKIRVSPPGEIH